MKTFTTLFSCRTTCTRVCFKVCLLLLIGVEALSARSGLLELRNQQKIREAGFTDIELDRLHSDIGQSVFQLKQLAKPALKTDDESIEIQPSRLNSFMVATDKDGQTYYRLRLKEGLNFTTEPTPNRFLFKAYAYLYIDEAGKLNKVILQFYRMKFSGLQYTRELRRITHPGPFGDGAAQSPLQIEFRSYESSLPREDLSDDDIPLPVLSGKPQLFSVLHDPDDPIPFDKQSRIIETYRSLLRKLDNQLKKEKSVLLLNQQNDIDRALDFTGTSF